MAMHLDFEILSPRRMMRNRMLWSPRHGKQQDVVPQDWSLPEKMGIKRGTRVLFFAGAAGDWANELANRGVEVHYSDASKKMVQYAKGRFPSTKIRSFRVADAARWPEKGVKYDRMVSFEPIPLTHTSLPVTLLRSIAHANGAIIAFSHLQPTEAVEALMERMRLLYGARFKREVKRVRRSSLDHVGLGAPAEITLLRLDAPKAGGLHTANRDLSVLMAIGDRKDVSLHALAQNPKLAPYHFTEKDLLRSLSRLSELSKHTMPEVRRTVAVKAEEFHPEFVPPHLRFLGKPVKKQ